METHTNFYGSNITNFNLAKNIFDVSVTNLIKHTSESVTNECLQDVKIVNISEPKNVIDIPIKIKQEVHGDQDKVSHESVCEINGVAIPSYFEYKTQNKMSIMECLESNESNNLDVYEINDEASKLSIERLLQLSTRWCAIKSGYLFKTYQIKKYDWISEANLDKCINNLHQLNIENDSQFEKFYQIINRPELYNRRLKGYVDCIDSNSMYEFKCVNQLNNEHVLQTLMYMYLIKCNDLTTYDKCTFYLYNIINDHKIEISCDEKVLDNIVNILMFNKFFKTYNMSNEVFFNKINEIKQKY